MNLEIISLNNLKKSYGSDDILDVKHFSFKRGYKYLLVGENGSGKSTLLKIIIGIISSYSGEVIRNYDSISYVPEKSILPDFINLMRFLSGYDTSKIKELSDLFDININKPFYKYSKGMRQKAIIIQSLIKESELLLFDEPLSGLDNLSKKNLINYILNTKSTVIISTHYLEQFDGYGFLKVSISGKSLCLE